MNEDGTAMSPSLGHRALGSAARGSAADSEMAEWRTYAQSAYDEIRARILSGRLGPGARIVVRVLSEELGLSPTPIKMALAALEREGFLHSVAYRGYSVPQTDLAAVAESFEVIGAMDMLAVRRIMARADRQQVVDELRAMVARHRADLDAVSRDAGAPDRTDQRRRSFELNFHRVLWERSGNRQLGAVADHQRGLILVASGGLPEPPERRQQVLAEHIALLDAVLSGDVAGAVALCEKHMTVSAKDAVDRLAGRCQT